MNKVLIIESYDKRVQTDFNSMGIVHVRNSLLLKDILECDFITQASKINDIVNNKYDVIICVYASHYMYYNQYMKILDNNNNAKLYWMVNEHGLGDNILLRNYIKKYKRGFDVISNNTRTSFKQGQLNRVLHDKTLNEWIKEWYTINLNSIIFDIDADRKKQNNYFLPDKVDCIYYGTFRPNRIDDMKDYNDFNYVISSSTKNHKKYMSAGIKARYIDKLNWKIGYEDLYNYKYSIYFEDKHTHDNYEYMTNRFYECLMCDVLLFFDYRCMNTIEQSCYNINEYLIVKNGKELKEKIKELNNDMELYNKILNEQRKNKILATDERNKTIKELKKILHKKIDKEILLDIPQTILVDENYF